MRRGTCLIGLLFRVLINLVLNDICSASIVLANILGNIQCKCVFQFQMSLMVQDYDDMMT